MLHRCRLGECRRGAGAGLEVPAGVAGDGEAPEATPWPAARPVSAVCRHGTSCADCLRLQACRASVHAASMARDRWPSRSSCVPARPRRSLPPGVLIRAESSAGVGREACRSSRLLRYWDSETPSSAARDFRTACTSSGTSLIWTSVPILICIISYTTHTHSSQHQYLATSPSAVPGDAPARRAAASSASHRSARAAARCRRRRSPSRARRRPRPPAARAAPAPPP